MENMTINTIKLASNLAEMALGRFIGGLSEGQYDFEFPNGTYIEDDEETIYTEEAQDIFNGFYDEFLDVIENCKV